MTGKAKSNGFVKLEHGFLRSEQFGELSAHAKALLLGIADQHNGFNNGAIVFSVRQATTWLHCGKDTASKTFRELEASGLIEAVERGSFSLKTGRGRATRWRLKFLV